MAGSTAPYSVAKWVGIGVACLVALVGSFALAWWQWDRYEEGGTFQNLGYVLQWPLFGVFPAFLVWRVRRLDARREPESSADTVDDTPAPAPEPDGPSLGYVPPRRNPEDEREPALAEYNRYLAGLHAGEDEQQREQRHEQ